MKVYRDHAFIVADNAGRHGMQVFDLTRLRDVTVPPMTFTPDTTYFEIHSSHNIAINESAGYAFLVGNSAGGQTCGGQAHMVDIRDPKRPVYAGCAGPESTHTHDLQCVTYEGPDADYRGREVCFHSAAELLAITDVTDKDNPTVIATATYPSLVYAHQGWLSEDGQYFYLNDELDEITDAVDRTRTMIFDVADLDDPVLVNEYMGETGATDHNLYVHGNLMYESNYVAGLRVLDISDAENPVEIGYFDTVTGSPNAAGFAGSWSNYPYFASGIVVVTSIREGLFVLRPQPRTLVP
jgi:choice-of-anchor B domain-containing protein